MSRLCLIYTTTAKEQREPIPVYSYTKKLMRTNLSSIQYISRTRRPYFLIWIKLKVDTLLVSSFTSAHRLAASGEGSTGRSGDPREIDACSFAQVRAGVLPQARSGVCTPLLWLADLPVRRCNRTKCHSVGHSEPHPTPTATITQI